MQFDYIIQVGVWFGSAAQIECLRQTSRDVHFEDYASFDEFLEEIEASHNEEDVNSARGPIDPDARKRYENLFRDAWERSHT